MKKVVTFATIMFAFGIPFSAAQAAEYGQKIKLKSWKGDYLHRPDSRQGVTTWHTGIGNEWTVNCVSKSLLECLKNDKVTLKSWKGDYLHRPDSKQGVTTWHTGVGNQWVFQHIANNKIKLKSWKGDYLHRPDSKQGVTTWHTGAGNEWIVEAVNDNPVKNVALKKAVQQSSLGWGGDPKRAVDGNTSGNYRHKSVTHTQSQNQSWWQVDLGKMYDIKTINVYNRTDCCNTRLSNFYVIVSKTPFPAELNKAKSKAGWNQHVAGNAKQKESFSVGVKGRYVRVQLSGSNYLSLAEVEVMGY